MITPARRKLAIEILRFGVVGASGFVVDTAVVYGLRGLVGLIAAGIASYFVAASWTWWLNRTWTFAGRSGAGRGGDQAAWKQWLWFMFVNLSGLLFNRGAYVLLVLYSATCRDWPVLAVAAGAVAGMFANFYLSRRLVFR